MSPANWCASFCTPTLDNPWLDECVVAVRKELDFFGQRRHHTRNCYEDRWGARVCVRVRQGSRFSSQLVLTLVCSLPNVTLSATCRSSWKVSE